MFEKRDQKFCMGCRMTLVVGIRVVMSDRLYKAPFIDLNITTIAYSI